MANSEIIGAGQDPAHRAPEETKNQLRQSSIACPGCGSWYRRGPECNICGTVVPEPVAARMVILDTKDYRKQWSKKRGRYLTRNETNSGLSRW